MEKLLPHNIEAEESVLGSLIIDPEAIALVEEVLRPADFYRDAHRALYQAMLTLCARREPGDLVTLCNELERTSTLEHVGGAAALVSLMNGVPTSANALYYARIVAQKALYRRLIAAAGRMAALAYEEADDALEEAEQLVFALGQGQGEASALTPVQVVLSDCMTTLDALHERKTAITGVPTGYRHLDAPLGGLQRSDLVILAARPATGKTSFALNVARNALPGGLPGGLLQPGDEPPAAGDAPPVDGGRALTSTACASGASRIDEWEQLVAALGILSEGQLWIDDTAALSLASLRSRARRMQAKPGVDLIVVDYLQLMRPLWMASACRTASRRSPRSAAGSRQLPRNWMCRCWPWPSSPAPSSRVPVACPSSPIYAKAVRSKTTRTWCSSSTATTSTTRRVRLQAPLT